jgi:UDP:flavonoid glycosyltransferase YjiC (YdhE family)
VRYLFTTLPSNDLGLLVRSLPIASILRARGDEVVFSSPAKAPRALVADAGFVNASPVHPLYDLASHASPSALLRFARTRGWRRHGSLARFACDVARAIPTRFAPPTAEVWSMDHAAAQMGLSNEGFVRASVDGLRRLIGEQHVDVVVDFWNPLAVIAARSLKKPVVSVIQADAHPASRGFLWWKTPPPDLPTVVPVINRVLATHGLAPVRKLADLSIGDLTLVVGAPETDPLPAGADVTYVGSLLWQKPGAALPSAVASLPRDQPLIWVYAGNPRYGSKNEALDSFVVLEASLVALAALDVNVVVSTGHHALPRELLPLPPRVVHERYVPG